MEEEEPLGPNPFSSGDQRHGRWIEFSQRAAVELAKLAADCLRLKRQINPFTPSWQAFIHRLKIETDLEIGIFAIHAKYWMLGMVVDSETATEYIRKLKQAAEAALRDDELRQISGSGSVAFHEGIQEVVYDYSAQALELANGGQEATFRAESTRATSDKNDDTEAARAKVRSEWLDARYAEENGLSDNTLSERGGPTYNTVRKYRSGKTSNRIISVRQGLATALKQNIEDVPL